MGFPVLFAREEKKKKPFGMVPFAIAWAVHSFGSWLMGKR